MNKKRFNEKQGELISMIETFLKENQILDASERLEVSLVVSPAPKVTLTIDEILAMDRAMAMPIDKFLRESEFAKGFYPRVSNIVGNMPNIHFVGQLARKTEGEFLRYRNSGKRTLGEVKHALQKLNLTMGYGDSMPPGKLEKAALESIETCLAFDGSDECITSNFRTIGEVSRASKDDLKVAFRKNTDVRIEFVDFLRWTAQILHRFHLTGAFESES